MASYKNAYDTLYTNMKNAFTVVNDGYESTLGEYMLRKAAEKNASSNLPVASVAKDNAIAAVFSYVQDKLTVKTPPVKDKTMRAFPFRASLAAVLSAVVTCGLVVTYGVAASGSEDQGSYIAEIEEVENSDRDGKVQYETTGYQH